MEVSVVKLSKHNYPEWKSSIILAALELDCVKYLFEQKDLDKAADAKTKKNYWKLARLITASANVPGFRHLVIRDSEAQADDLDWSKPHQMMARIKKEFKSDHHAVRHTFKLRFYSITLLPHESLSQFVARLNAAAEAANKAVRSSKLDITSGEYHMLQYAHTSQKILGNKAAAKLFKDLVDADKTLTPILQKYIDDDNLETPDPLEHDDWSSTIDQTTSYVCYYLQ
jgi:hypothetical protein